MTFMLMAVRESLLEFYSDKSNSSTCSGFGGDTSYMCCKVDTIPCMCTDPLSWTANILLAT